MNIQINGANIYYETYGSGLPVLCIHGFGVDSTLMKECMEPVFCKKTHYQRVYVDLVGMGKSPANYDVKNADDLLKILIGFIEKIFGKKEFLLMGESYGCYLCLGLIKHFGAKIKGFFSICPCFVPSHEDRCLPQKEVISYSEINIDENEQENYNSFLDIAVIVNQKTWNRYKSSILPGLEVANFEYLNWFQSNGYYFSNDPIHFYNNPSVFLLGRQDHIVGYSDTLRLMKYFPRASFLILDSAGHNLQIEQQDLFRSVLKAFLKQFDQI